MADPPPATRFSQLYIDRSGKPLPDSRRFRTRLLARFSELQMLVEFRKLAARVAQETGVEPTLGGDAGYAISWRDFFLKAELRDVLDALTFVWQALAPFQGNHAAQWLEFVRRAMHEENMGYRVDSKCIVHLLVDPEFEANTAAVIGALAAPRYKATLEEFNKAHACLDGDPPDGKGAVRGTFEAAEILFKLIFGGDKVPRLEAGAINNTLKLFVQRIYTGNEPALNAANLMCSAFADWASACHQYRHGAGTEEPIPPPLDVAVVMVSTGASFIRWLAEIDQRSSAAI